MKNGFNFLTDLLPTTIGKQWLDTRACSAIACICKLAEDVPNYEKAVYMSSKLFHRSYDSALEASGMTEEEFDKAIVGYLDGADPVKSWSELNGEKAENERKKYRKPDFDFCQDSGAIISAFRQCYSLSLDDVCNLHWWEFLALFCNLPHEGCWFSEMRRIRSMNVDPKDSPERKQEIREAKKAVALKDKRTPKQVQADRAEMFNQIDI